MWLCHRIASEQACRVAGMLKCFCAACDQYQGAGLRTDLRAETLGIEWQLLVRFQRLCTFRNFISVGQPRTRGDCVSAQTGRMVQSVFYENDNTCGTVLAIKLPIVRLTAVSLRQTPPTLFPRGRANNFNATSMLVVRSEPTRCSHWNPYRYFPQENRSLPDNPSFSRRRQPQHSSPSIRSGCTAWGTGYRI